MKKYTISGKDKLHRKPPYLTQIHSLLTQILSLGDRTPKDIFVTYFQIFSHKIEFAIKCHGCKLHFSNCITK